MCRLAKHHQRRDVFRIVVAAAKQTAVERADGDADGGGVMEWDGIGCGRGSGGGSKANC